MKSKILSLMLPLPAVRGQGKRAVGRDRSHQLGAGYHQRGEEHHADHHDRQEHGQQLQGDGQDLRAGKEILRRPETSE